MEKNLSKEFRETMENVKALRMVNRLLDLCCDMFEKQDKLMDKMNEAMDKYLKA